MCVRGKSDGHTHLPGQSHDLRTGIDFPAILAQAGGVEFEGDPFLPRRLEKAGEQRRAIPRWVIAKFLAQIGVGNGFEQSRGGRHRESLEVSGPDLEGVAGLPFRDFFGIIEVPRIGDIMDGADQVVPRMPRRQLANPLFVPGQIIDFQGDADVQVLVVSTRLFDLLDVLVEVAEEHAPVVKVIPRHGTVFGEADLRQAQLDRLSGVLAGFADRVMAQVKMPKTSGEFRA